MSTSIFFGMLINVLENLINAVKISRIFIHPTPILMPVAQPCPTKQARDKRTGTVRAPPLKTDVVNVISEI